MSQPSLGLIETIGLAAAVEAADAAVKSANVVLVGYELAKGDGMTVVKIQGEVGAVNAAVAAAAAAAAKINRVVSTKVIARPAEALAALVITPDTVGAAMPSRPAAVAPETPPVQETPPVAEAPASLPVSLPTDPPRGDEPQPVPAADPAVSAPEPAPAPAPAPVPAPAPALAPGQDAARKNRKPKPQAPGLKGDKS